MTDDEDPRLARLTGICDALPETTRGWIGLRLDRGDVDGDEVADFVTDGYLLVAPNRLAARVEATGAGD